MKIIEEEKCSRELLNKEFHELRMEGEEVRQEMEQRILAEDLRTYVKQFQRMIKLRWKYDQIEMESNKNKYVKKKSTRIFEENLPISLIKILENHKLVNLQHCKR